MKFRDDHPEYPGMVGIVEEDITIPGGEPMVGVRLDLVPATADEIEQWDNEVHEATGHPLGTCMACQEFHLATEPSDQSGQS